MNKIREPKIATDLYCASTIDGMLGRALDHPQLQPAFEFVVGNSEFVDKVAKQIINNLNADEEAVFQAGRTVALLAILYHSDDPDVLEWLDEIEDHIPSKSMANTMIDKVRKKLEE